MATTVGMQMAKSSPEDIDAAMDLANALESMARGYLDDEECTPLDQDDGESCRQAIARLLELHDRGSLLRVVWGMATILNPENAIVDPDASVLQLHPSLIRRPE